MSCVDINREDALWDWLAELEKQGMHVDRDPAQLERQQGHDVRAEASRTASRSTPSTRKCAAAFEPLIEMMQIKGNSEVHRSFWAADEFANFENADSLGDYSGRDLRSSARRTGCAGA